jgi:hypothetical protein
MMTVRIFHVRRSGFVVPFAEKGFYHVRLHSYLEHYTRPLRISVFAWLKQRLHSIEADTDDNNADCWLIVSGTLHYEDHYTVHEKP